jgi:hypothetical protein
MTDRSLLSMSVILSTAIAAPSFAQSVAREPDAYVLHLSHVGTGIDSAASEQRDASIIRPGKIEPMPSASSLRPWKAGNGNQTLVSASRSPSANRGRCS